MAKLPQEVIDALRTQFRMEEYRNSKRNKETKKYIELFIRFFNEHATEWIRTKEIYSALVKPDIIPYTSQVTRLLSELTDIGIIERREETRIKGTRGSPPVYYLLRSRVPEEIDTELLNYKLKLDIAIELLKEAGINPAEIDKRIREL